LSRPADVAPDTQITQNERIVHGNTLTTPGLFCNRCFYDIFEYPTGPAEVDNDWSGRTSGFYGRYFQKEAQQDYRVSSGVLLKIEVGIR